MLSLHKLGPEKFEDKLLELVGSSPSPDDLLDNFHPFSWACMESNLRLLRRLVPVCGNINSRNEDGSTALTWAPNWEFSRLLMSLGARVSAERPDDGLTSLHIAAEKGRPDQIELLLSQGGGPCALETFDYLGRTPLACAVYEGHLAATLTLLKAGSNPNAVDKDRCSTVLQFALERGHDGLAQILIDHGADPELRVGLSQAPRVIAAEQLIAFPTAVSKKSNRRSSKRGV